jgi:putative GTP pyrophosphokinase
MLSQQPDVAVIETEDYIAHPKPNGYKSFHMTIEVPVLSGDRVEWVPVELQIRTIAMDFWASLEHKIYTTYERDVPPRLLNELTDAADAAHTLDLKMQRLHNEVAALTAAQDAHDVHLDLLPPSTINDRRPGTGRHL